MAATDAVRDARLSQIAKKVHSDQKVGSSADRFITPQKPADLRGPGVRLVIRGGRVVGASVG